MTSHPHRPARRRLFNLAHWLALSATACLSLAANGQNLYVLGDGFDTVPRAISLDGSTVVGFDIPPTNRARPFSWTPKGGLEHLSGALTRGRGCHGRQWRRVDGLRIRGERGSPDARLPMDAPVGVGDV